MSISKLSMSGVKRLNPFSPLLERHFDDAAFLWVLRSVAVKQPHYGLVELKKLESRIDKHIDALVLAPDDAWEHSQQAQVFEEGGEAFVAAMLAFRLMDVDKIRIATEFGLANASTFKGLCSALGWLSSQYARPWIDKFLKSKDLDHKHLAIAVCSIKREDPGEYLQNILTREDCLAHIPLHCRALRLVGELKRRDLVPALNQAMGHEDSHVKFWAFWSAVLLGNRAAVQQLKPYMLEPGECREAAIELAFRALPIAEARQWISELAKTEDSARWVIQASGALGDSQVVAWLIEKMKDPALARVAAQAFVAISGIDLEQYELANAVPDLFDELANKEEDMDEYTMADENLPWPNTEKVAAVWQKYGKSFPPGNRYFWGKAQDQNMLRSVLVRGGQRQRSAAALVLALMQPEEPYVNVTARVTGDLIGE